MTRKASLLFLVPLVVLMFGAGSAGAASPVHIRQVEPKGYPNMEVTVSADGS